MRKRTFTAITVAALAGLGGVVPGAAAAAGSGDTVSTFTLAGNASGLSVSVPVGTSQSPVALGTGNTGDASLSGSLGTVQVDDTRGSLVATWTAGVASTDFTTGDASSNETVPKADITYQSNAATGLLNGQVGLFTGTVGAVSLSSGSATAGSWAGVGNNKVSWNPTIAFTLKPSQVAGTYTGTVTHSVS